MAENLADHLAALIRTQGPITVSLYMAECLGNPRWGYYMTRDPLGREGDFTTAPEISQMFGELIGLWCVAAWQAAGKPDPVLLVELGPGRGTLMADALRAAAMAPDFRQAARLHLVETSPALRRRQAETLTPTGVQATWHERLDSVPEDPQLLVANEFFDALPIRQFVRGENGWRERLIDIDEALPGRFRFVAMPGPAEPDIGLPADMMDAPPGSIAEISPAATSLAADCARRIGTTGIAALVIDYGHGRSAVGDTLQAVRRQAFHDVLAEPGNADLTAHVDFAALGRAARGEGAATWGPVDQGAFLRALGIETRAAKLAEKATSRQKRDIVEALQRLTGADGMGSLFKAMAISRPDLPTPPGFGN